MTPAPQQLASPRNPPREALVASFGLLSLAALFLPSRQAATHAISIDWRPSAELAGLFFLVAMTALAAPRFLVRSGPAAVVALLVTAAALLNLIGAATPMLLGRELNPYWDLKHLPSLFGLARESAGPWRLAAAEAIIFVAISLLFATVFLICRRVLLALTDRRIAIGAAVVLGVALDVTAFAPAEHRPLATAFGAEIVRHATQFERFWQRSARGAGPLPAALAAPGPPLSNLAGLKQRDVYLVYIESYGTTVFDTPEFRERLKGAFAQFEKALRGSGYRVASNRLVSPTFGGGSWLAHATLASGIRLDDPVVYAQLLGSGRKLLPAYFKAAGWQAVEIMPGIKAPGPEAEAWGFDRRIYAAELGYLGPSFGWFAIPDQFTLERAAAFRAGFGAESRVFTQIVLVSSHIPFSPLPPYLTDWADAGTFATVPKGAWEEINRTPDWSALSPYYLRSLQYDFAVLGDWLASRLPGQALVILLGDHQPPAVIGGELKEWTVPIHVLSRDPDLIAPFVAAGYVDGLVPTQAPPYLGMETFLPRFLAAFDRPG
jgi:hypothetical protein